MERKRIIDSCSLADLEPMRKSRKEFEAQFESAKESVATTNAILARMMHKESECTAIKLKRILDGILHVEECLCARPDCPGWVVVEEKQDEAEADSVRGEVRGGG